jgi:hypothetical protein
MVAGVGNNNLKTKTKIMVLKKGGTGPEVEELQKILGIKVDGDFGPATKLAVMKYQAQNDLIADGIVGSKTWAKMTSKTSSDSGSKYIWILDNGHGGIIDGVYQTSGKRSPKWEDGTQLFEGEFNRAVVKRIVKLCEDSDIECINLGILL